jgi:membrane protease YdiL (CAAX protease family)
MANITSFSVHAAYGLALGLFMAAAWWRFSLAAAKGLDAPPGLPVGKVPVWIYRPIDLLGLGIIAGVFYLLAVGNAVAGESGKPPGLSVEGIVLSIGFLIFMAVIPVAIVSRRMGLGQWLGLRWKEWPWVMLIAPATVFTMWAFFAGLQGLGYMDLMDRLGVQKVQDTVAIFQDAKDPALLILMAFAAVIVAPICEEVVFRGYLYPAAKRFAGPWVAALCTALMFSAAHGSMAALLPLFVFGLVLVALYEFTGSIWAPVAAHFLFNAATVTIQMLVRFIDLPAEALK